MYAVSPRLLETPGTRPDEGNLSQNVSQSLSLSLCLSVALSLSVSLRSLSLSLSVSLSLSGTQAWPKAALVPTRETTKMKLECLGKALECFLPVQTVGSDLGQKPGKIWGWPV